MERTLSTILERAAENAIENQRADGSFPEGVNGPYNDPETPVRATSHWLFTLSKLCSDRFNSKIEPENLTSFEEAAGRAIGYLQSETARPYEKTFRHRSSDKKDECNGLIGQAWTIEALVEAGRVFGRTDLIDLAEDVFLLHPFDAETALWRRTDTDGELLGFDRTFNHQLWFAAAGGELAQECNGSVADQVQQFLDNLLTLMDVTSEGRIRHLLRPSFGVGAYLRYLTQRHRRELTRNVILSPIRPPSNRRDLKQKSVGYQSFNLYGLALLHHNFPTHDIWDSEVIYQLFAYTDDDSFKERLRNNPYGYPYNVSGIELAFARHEFGFEEDRESDSWLHEQFSRTYNSESGLMDRNNPDPTILTARLYEATRLPDSTIKVDFQ